MRLLVTAVLAAVSLAAGTGDADTGAVTARITSGQGSATAELVDAGGDRIGTARLTQQGANGPVEVSVEIEGSDLEPGEHGLHVHETGIVSPDFEAAGGHFNPTGAEHGFQNPQGPHAGDLENITIDEDGSASYETTTDRVTLSEGEASLLDADGSALVVHENADDYATDPDGGSGAPVAAGVVEAGFLGLPQVLAILGALVLLAGFVGFLIYRVRRTSKG